MAALDRSGGGDIGAVLSDLVSALQSRPAEEETVVTDAAWGTLSNQAVAAAGVVYFLALLAYLLEWASLREPARSHPRPRSVPASAR